MKFMVDSVKIGIRAKKCLIFWKTLGGSSTWWPTGNPKCLHLPGLYKAFEHPSKKQHAKPVFLSETINDLWKANGTWLKKHTVDIFELISLYPRYITIFWVTCSSLSRWNWSRAEGVKQTHGFGHEKHVAKRHLIRKRKWGWERICSSTSHWFWTWDSSMPWGVQEMCPNTDSVKRTHLLVVCLGVLAFRGLVVLLTDGFRILQ